jgi:hypothetical protein
MELHNSTQLNFTSPTGKRKSDPDRHGVGDNFADLHTTRHFSILAERDRKGESEKKAERKRSPSPKKKAPSKSRSRERPSKGSPARAKKSASRSRYWYPTLYMRQFVMIVRSVSGDLCNNLLWVQMRRFIKLVYGVETADWGSL